jgi:hypothetical protein
MFAVVNLRAAEPGERQQRPVTLGEVRALLGLSAPDLRRVDVNAEEEKYSIVDS